jgi:Family of unknown function (DUF5906)
VNKKPEEALHELAADAGAITESKLAQHIRDFNERFFVVENFGGKCLVCFETVNHELQTRTLILGHQSFNDFRNRFGNKFIEVGKGRDGNPQYKTEAKAWIEYPGRRQYKQVAFAPGENLPLDIHNLWRGFAFTPKKGDCTLYLEHLKDNICGGNEKYYKWLLGWMAHKVQNPGRQGFTAVVLRGKEGIGKNFCAEPFAKLFGSHYLCVTRREHVAGHFNNHLRACCCLIANEAFFAGDRQHEASLKGLITDTFLMIEAKGVDAVQSRNRLAIIILSNSSWVVPAGPEARRYAVFDCSDGRKEDTVYFGKLQAQLDDGGYAALLYHLLHEVDITGFNPHKAIRTEALAEQQSQSLRGVDAMWFECLYRGELPGFEDDAGYYVQSERILTWGKLQHRRDWTEITAEQLGLLLGINPRGVSSGMGFEKTKVTPVRERKRVRVWKIPELPEARKLWDEKRFKVSWTGEDDEWQFVKVGDERPGATTLQE